MQQPGKPEGYHSLTPYLIVSDGNAALEFYAEAFGTRERMVMRDDNGKVQHSELEVGDSVVMVADEFPEIGARSPATVGGSPVYLLLYVADVDAQFAAALAAGGRELRPLQNQFYGDRSGTLLDPFGHQWTLATHIEDVAPDELERRMKAEEERA